MIVMRAARTSLPSRPPEDRMRMHEIISQGIGWSATGTPFG